MFYLKQIAQLGFVLVFVVSLLSLFLYFKNSETLGIKKIEVLGELQHLSKDDVIKLSGINKNDKLFTVSLSDIQRKIKRFSWVEDAMVRREFPDTIQIHVTEKVPAALILLDDLYFMDQYGSIFKKVDDSETYDLPIVTGFKTEELKSYPHLMRSYLNLCMTFLTYINGQEFYKKEIVSELRFDRVFGFTIYTKKSHMEIFYGLNQFMQKHKNLEQFSLSEVYKTKNFVRLDLNASDKIVARKL